MNGIQKVQIVVIDGMGGGLGSQIISRLKERFRTEVEITALGTNALATSRMMQSGAQRGATGENAIRVNINNADIIVGPLGILMPNALMGEITPSMAELIGLARGKKILLPVNQSHFTLIGMANKPMSGMIDDLITVIEEELGYGKEKQL